MNFWPNYCATIEAKTQCKWSSARRWRYCQGETNKHIRSRVQTTDFLEFILNFPVRITLNRENGQVMLQHISQFNGNESNVWKCAHTHTHTGFSCSDGTAFTHLIHPNSIHKPNFLYANTQRHAGTNRFQFTNQKKCSALPCSDNKKYAIRMKENWYSSKKKIRNICKHNE